MMTVHHVKVEESGDISKLSDAQLKSMMEETGYKFQNKCRVYRSNPDYILREIAGEAVLVSIGGGVADFCGIIHLNSSAKVLWQAMQQGATEDELVQKLKNNFAISDEKAAEDVEKALELLKKKGLVACE